LYLTIETRSWHLGERAVNKGENSNPVDFERIQNPKQNGEKQKKTNETRKTAEKSTKNDLPDLY
jgi:hypothetical protein